MKGFFSRLAALIWWGVNIVFVLALLVFFDDFFISYEPTLLGDSRELRLFKQLFYTVPFFIGAYVIHWLVTGKWTPLREDADKSDPNA
jgi:hypothetical protein